MPKVDLFSSPQVMGIEQKDGLNVCLMESSGEVTTSACIFKDNGGDDNYSNDFIGTMVFKPQNPNAKIRVSFSSFNVETGTNCKWDHLVIYDGADNTATELGKFCGTDNPGTFTSTAADGSLCFYFKSDGSGVRDGWEADIIEYIPSDMVYASSELVQTNISLAQTGGENLEILGVKLITTGDLNPINLTDLKFATQGTTSPADLVKAKLYYSGNSSTFSIDNSLGEIENPNGDFSFSTAQPLLTGTNYFWLAYDLSSSAIDGNTIDAECKSIGVAGVDYIPASANPDGARIIKEMLLMEAGAKTYKVLKSIAFYDDGGPSNDCTKGLKGTITFEPKDANNKVQIDFTSYELATLKVYNGKSTDTEIIGTYTSSGIPGLIKSSSADGCLTVEVNSSTSSSYEGWEALVSNYEPAPMSYVGSDVYQDKTGFVAPGDEMKELLTFKIETVGLLSPINVDNIKLALNGTTDINDITKLRIYYGGNSKIFTASETNLIKEINTVLGNELTINLDKALALGDNYFKIFVDISTDAVDDNVIDAQINKIAVANVEQTPTTTSPAGQRTVKNMFLLKSGTNTVKVLKNLAFYDNGGIDGSHAKGFTGIVIFEPKDTEHKVQIDFSAFHASTLYIYNGNSTSATRIGSYTGTQNPGLVKSTSADGCLTVKFRSYYSGPYAGWEASVSNYLPAPMTYVSSDVFQDNQDDVSTGDIKQELIGFKIKTEGLLNPLTGQSLKINLSGATKFDDIEKLAVYYGGDIKDFSSSSNTKLAEIIDITGEEQVISFSQDLGIGDNYFWIAADIKETAEQNNVIDAKIVKIAVSGSDYIPANANPDGCRVVKKTYLMETYKEITTSGGVFYDDGGLAGEYSDNFEGTVIFKPLNPDNKISIKFTDFATEEGYDYVEIYDGEAPGDNNLLGKFEGYDLPGEFTSTATNGNLCVYFHSDSGTSEDGWIAEISEFIASDMVFESTETIAYSDEDICKGTLAEAIIGVKIITSGSKNALELQNLDIDTKGTQNVSNIKVFYTKGSEKFTRDNLVANQVITGAVERVGLNQSLAMADNYFWITYDISPNAVNEDIVKAECNTITVSSINHNNTMLNHAGRVIGSSIEMSHTINNTLVVDGDITFTDDGGVTGNHSREGQGTLIFEPADPSKKIRVEFSEFELQNYGVDFIAYNGKATEGSNTIKNMKGSDIPTPVKSTADDGALRFYFEPSANFISKPGWVSKVSCYEPRALFLESSLTSQTERHFLQPNTKDQLILGVELNVAGEKDNLNLQKMTFSTEGCSNITDIRSAKLYYTNNPDQYANGEMLAEVIAPNGDFTFEFEKEISREATYYFWLCFDIANDAKIGNRIDAVFKSATADANKVDFNNGDPIGKRIIRGALSGTYRINNNPLVDADFMSPKEAAEALNALGVISSVNFSIADGEYKGAIEINEITGVSDQNKISFSALSGNRDNVILSHEGTPEENTLLVLNGTDYITFKDLTFKVTGTTYSRIVEYYNSACHNSFVNNIFEGLETTDSDYDNDKVLVYASNSTYKIVDNNNVFESNIFKYGKVALYIAGIDNVSEFETGLVIKNNTFIDQYFMSVYLSYQNDLLIEANTFNLSEAKREHWACRVYKSKKNCRIQGNRFNLDLGSKGGAAIMLQGFDTDGESRSLVANNMIYTTSTSGSVGISLEDGKSLDIIHNTIKNAGTNTYSKAFFFEKRGTSPVFEDVNIKNNIFSTTSGAYLIWSKIQPTNSSVSNNNYYSEDNGSHFIKLGDISVTSFEDWQAAYPDDTNSIHIDPDFVSETDLHISGTSLKFGVQIDGITKDIDGDLRNAATPYIGADEVPDATFIGGYPKFEETTAVSTTLLLKSSEAGIAYVLVLPEGSDLPDEAQIKAGENANNGESVFASFVRIELDKESEIEITGLTEKTDYDVIVVEEKADESFSGIIRLKLSTLDITAPEFIEGTPVLKDITNNSFVVKAEINESGFIYYGVYAGSITSVSVNDVISGNGALLAGHNNAAKEKLIRCQNLSAGTDYNLFMVAQDNQDEANVQTTVTKLSLKTLYGNSIKNFLAEGIGNSEVKLSWLQTTTPADVMIVFSETNVFGRPVAGNTYQIGDVLTDGGGVIYNGKADNFRHAGLEEGKTYYYRAYTYNSEKEYSQYMENFVVLKNDNWTILVYMDGDNNLEGNAILDINEMEAVDLPDNVNVIVQIDRNPGYDYSNDNWTETRRYKIVHDTDTKNIGSIWLDEANPIGELNMGHPETLSNFIEWGVKTYPSKKTILILWDHGGGWRSEQDNTFNLTKGVCWDDTNGNDYLEMREVASAMELAKNRSNKTINVMGFDVCLAGMTEVAYELKDQVSDYYVFSQALEPGTGWDYDNWMSSFVSTPDISTLDISRSVVSTYQANYEGQNDVTLSVFDATKLEAVKTAIDDFVSTYASHNVEANVINSAFDNSDLFTARKNYIDLGLFMNHCATYLDNVETKSKAQLVKTLLDEAIVAIGNTGVYNEATGLNIYFHKYDDYEWNDYKAPYCNFADKSNWKTFIKTYDKDGQAPLFIDGFPNTMNLSSSVFDLSVKSNKSGFAYFVILGDNAEMPTISQIKAGQNSLGLSLKSKFKGKISMTRYEITKQSIAELEEATDYDIYFVLEDESGICANSAYKYEVRTLDRNVATFEKLLLANDSFWNGADNSGGFDNGGFHFPNYYSSMAWSGFAYSNRTDNTVEGIPGQYTAYAGGGAESSENYAVAYVFGSLIRVDITDAGEGVPVTGMYVTNNNFAVHSMKNGDAIAKKFGGDSGNDPDWFKLVVKGVDTQGHYTGDVEIYLADFRFEDNSKDYILDKWKWLDLSPLGNIVKLEYRLESSDGGSGGNMNTPGYFCMDNMNAEAPVDHAPVINHPFENLIVDENTADKTLYLKDIFTDEDNDELNFEIVANTNAELVNASIDQSDLKLSFETDKFGSAELTVRASANDKFVEATLNITINEVDHAPIVAQAIADVVVNENAADKLIDLSTVFSDIDGDDFSYEIVSNTDELLVYTSLNDEILSLSFLPGMSGDAVVTLRAFANGKSIETSVAITVDMVTSIEDVELVEVSMYPNPCLNKLNIIAVGDIIYCVKIMDLSGHIVSLSKPNSNSYCADMSNLPSGMYIVNIKTDNDVINKKVIKN
jgi:hypothetical protein